ncbi:MAG TPA: DNA-directed RNA polymerase subunit beta [Candidatus Dependentiae bacterium]|nr:DNA-directed RNA polymerase subunit beta [Candidatus Dependentiae bacterium]HRQ62250.1 DNA-directed RNA polymerase subunit beta [Candidatus Dependentiae bacterium]
MSNFRTGKGAVRRSFGRVQDIVPVPNLIEIQSTSFNDFVQLDYLPEERQLIGLERVLRDVFPIEHEDKLSLEYVSYELGNWACTCGKLTGIENRYTWSCSACKKTGCSRLPNDFSCPSCTKQSARYKTCSNCLARVVVQLPMTLAECRSSGQTFGMPLKVRMQLTSWDVDDKGNKLVRDIKEQDIFFTDIPVMADLYEEGGRFKLGNLGTFLINGVDRVIVSQLHRSPGVVFSQSKKGKDFRGRPFYLARIIPMRGSWIDFEFDSNDHLYVRIDKKKKLLATTFLQALGIERDAIIPMFYASDTIVYEKGAFYCVVDASLLGQRLERGMLPEEHEKAFVGKRVTKEVLSRLQKAGIDKLVLKRTGLLNRVFSKDVIDPETGEVIIEQGTVCSEDYLDLIEKHKKFEFSLIQSSGYVFQPTIAMTLTQDRSFTLEDALKDLHAKVWPGDSSSLKEIKERFENLFFNSRFYDLTKVGRIRMNRKLGLNGPEDRAVLTQEDIVATMRYLVNLRERGEGELDDIDHLGNRRVRLVGELLNNQMYLGFMRIERIVRERFRMQEAHGALMPQDFLNVKPLSAVVREFFGMGQLSQFMDQTNPLAEIAHKRRLSALGPGGVMKDRATYEIRDVHNSHYGRICPIETPEGQTVGLISSLATYAMVNDLGFIETAYSPVKDGKIQDDVVFMDAFQETEHYIAQADALKPGSKKLEGDKVLARHGGNFINVETDKIDYIDLSPKQLVSVSAALIPFLEHDDAVRALMGANMQRQAVPLIQTSAPIVGTGMEKSIAKASGAVITAKRTGTVEYVSSEKIIVRAPEHEFAHIDEWISQGVDTYYLDKFQRSSYSTWIHHTPIVRVGDRVERGDVLTNGSAIFNGELALGANLIVAFMPWNGYNFEDAIVLNKRLVSEDVLTSVHIDEYVVDARDTKLGPEEITRDIPNVSESALIGLDEDGIVRVGTRVKPGDILVGKVTLKGDVQFSPEEKLLRAIFGEKSREVRDTSLRVPPGVEGTVADVKIFSRSGVRKDKRYKEEINKQIEKVETNFAQHITSLGRMIAEKVREELHGQEPASTTIKGLLFKQKFDKDSLQNESIVELFKLKAKDKSANDIIKKLKDGYENQVRILTNLKDEHINKLKKGDTLPSGVIKVVKVYIAMKRPISAGDKLAGRHGNKGVVSNIVPREDMPLLEDGQAVDIVLNPLGVPSRMNVGQILETTLGLVGKKLGMQLQDIIENKGYDFVKKELIKFYGNDVIDSYEKLYGKDGVLQLARHTAKNGVFFKTPVFDGARFEEDIKPLMKEVGIPMSGSFNLRDGRTGEYFNQPVTVGYMYIMKLNHMVDDKLHARSVGPYSLVTQQPLGGKAQQGGQRLGEMEVWALEAYGAAYALQEMLTYKSDDVTGRHKAYQAIVRGENVPEPGVPESFNVLIKELQSLGLQVDLLKLGKETVSE